MVHDLNSDRRKRFFGLLNVGTGRVMGLTLLPVLWVPSLFPEVKRPESDVDHSLPSSIEVKNAWRCIYTPSERIHVVGSNNFTFCTFPYSYSFACLFMGFISVVKSRSVRKMGHIAFMKEMRNFYRILMGKN
jgi:hypothetical protein